MLNSISTDNISLSIRNGLRIRFVYKGIPIVVHQASWSFRERIWVGDKLVVNELGVRMVSTHVLQVAGDRVEVTFGYRDWMAEIFLEARANGQLIHSASHELDAVKAPGLLIWLILSGLAGAAVAHLVAA